VVADASMSLSMTVEVVFSIGCVVKLTDPIGRSSDHYGNETELSTRGIELN
jgi:hypothetical protein